MTHTKGPWKVECVETEHHGYPGWNTYTIRSPQNVCLAVVGEVDRYHQNDHTANARLIAAAPDLLAACEGCLGYFEYMASQGSDYTPDAAWLKPLRDAIAKSKGA